MEVRIHGISHLIFEELATFVLIMMSSYGKILSTLKLFQYQFPEIGLHQ